MESNSNLLYVYLYKLCKFSNAYDNSDLSIRVKGIPEATGVSLQSEHAGLI